MKIALPAELALMSVRLKQSAKETFMLSILKFVLTAVHVLMFARLKRSIRNNNSNTKALGASFRVPFFFNRFSG
jgi:hypothetical protein